MPRKKRDDSVRRAKALQKKRQATAMNKRIKIIFRNHERQVAQLERARQREQQRLIALDQAVELLELGFLNERARNHALLRF